MAALYILNESPFWFSNDFVRLDLWRVLQKRGEAVEISVSQQDFEDQQSQQSGISSDNRQEKYWKRRGSPEHVSFIDILERYDYANVKAGRKRACGVGTPSKQISYKRSAYSKVLVVSGKEIPDITSHLEPELRNFYYLSLLTLFKPHREFPLVTEDESPLDAYRSFLVQGDSTNVCRMEHFEAQLQDYYRAQKSDKQDHASEEDELLRRRAPATASSIPNSMEHSREPVGVTLDKSIPDDFVDVTAITTPDLSTQKLSDDANASVQSVQNLDNAITLTGQCYRNCRSDEAVGMDFDFESYASHIVTSNPNIDGEECLGTHNFITQFRESPRRLERLRECFEPVPYRVHEREPGCTPTTLPDFPTITLVSEAFQLNFWQHAVFEVAARHVLYAYSQDIAEALSEPMFPAETQQRPYDIKDQMIGYLGGEAGTGKSTVVDALLTLARKWGRAGSVETLAFTGVAAINIKGRTMHSARNLKLSGAEPNAPPTIEMKSRFSR